MLLEDGYIKYDGYLPLNYLDIVDGKIIELPLPEITSGVYEYSKLQIRRTARALGK